MKKRPIILSLVLYTLLHLFISCGKYPTQSDSPYGETILVNNLKVIDNMKGIELFNIDSHHIIYTFEIHNYYSDSIEIGDIIIGTAFGGDNKRILKIRY